MASGVGKYLLTLLLCVVLPAGGPGHAIGLPQLPLPPAPLSSPSIIPTGAIDPPLQLRLNLTGRSRVIVRAVGPSTVAGVIALIQQVGGTPGRQLRLIDAVAAEVPNVSLAVLASNVLVRRIALDRIVIGTDARTDATIGTAVARQQFGYDGSGVGVAVIDSGITDWHDDLMQSGIPGSQRIDQFVDLLNGRQAPYDDYGHGTHVAGIIAGNGYDSGGARTGIAPGVRLLILKVLDGSGRGRISDVIAAFEYVIQHRHEFNVRVINVSVGAGVSESYTTDFLAEASRRAVEQGIVVVAAAGNAGRRPDGRTQYGAIAAPGNAPWVLTVGASSHMGTTDRNDDTIADFSSRGPTAFDRAAKPDLVAPGVGIESLSDPDSAMFTTKSPYLMNGTEPTSYPPYLSLSGTSQAAPAVAGTVALMLQANPSLTPNAIKAILQYTAEAHAEYDVMTQGAGFLNARGAIELTRFLASPSTVSYPSTTGWGRALDWGNQRVASGYLEAAASAWAPDVVWGAPTTPTGQAVRWGITCSTESCDADGRWIAWESSCVDAKCESVLWDRGRSTNVVWGQRCGGADCARQPWQAPPGQEPDPAKNYVYGTSDQETLVWGTSDSGDTLVWGTSCGDPSCTPVKWQE